MSDREMEERLRANGVLESMISQLESDEDDEDPRTEWLVPQGEDGGETGAPGEDDEDEEDEDDEDAEFYIDEDELYEEDIEDEEAFMDMEADEADEVEGGDDDDEDEGTDFTAILQAVAANMAEGSQVEGNGASEVLRRLLASGRIQIGRARAAARVRGQNGGDDDDEDDDDEDVSTSFQRLMRKRLVDSGDMIVGKALLRNRSKRWRYASQGFLGSNQRAHQGRSGAVLWWRLWQGEL